MIDFRQYCESLNLSFGSLDKDSDQWRKLVKDFNSGFPLTLQTADHTKKISRPIPGTASPRRGSGWADKAPDGDNADCKMRIEQVSDREGGNKLQSVAIWKQSKVAIPGGDAHDLNQTNHVVQPIPSEGVTSTRSSGRDSGTQGGPEGLADPSTYQPCVDCGTAILRTSSATKYCHDCRVKRTKTEMPRFLKRHPGYLLPYYDYKKKLHYGIEGRPFCNRGDSQVCVIDGVKTRCPKTYKLTGIWDDVTCKDCLDMRGKA
jgi:hypothetical protein